LAHGDNIFAVIRGSWSNCMVIQWLTIPNGLAQKKWWAGRPTWDYADQTVISARTKTPLGDPIEVEALAECDGRWSAILSTLSCIAKTNIGHSAAAGMATSRVVL
jgi:acyl transferase domain-containing protein